MNGFNMENDGRFTLSPTLAPLDSRYHSHGCKIFPHNYLLIKHFDLVDYDHVDGKLTTTKILVVKAIYSRKLTFSHSVCSVGDCAKFLV